MLTIKSGLTKKVLESTNSLEQVNKDLLAYVKKHVPEARTGILAGNSVHQDKMFLCREFPELVDYLNYRIVDVSTIKEVGYRHNPNLMAMVPKKTFAHTARSDILESIQELKWYYEHYFVKPDNSNVAKGQ